MLEPAFGRGPLGEESAALGLKAGDQVLLHQDEGDLDVVATLSIEPVDVLDAEAWVARPDWSTLVRHETGEAAA